MKRLIMFILIASMFAFMPLVASAAELEGSVQGFTCVTQGKVCPAGMEDPMAAAEEVFVLLTKDNTYYFVPNVDRAVMARHINERVRITGDMNTQYNAINADKIEAYRGGSWQEVYSKETLEEIRRSIGVPGT